MDTAPALAEGTAGVEPASGAEKAAAAEPEALEPGVYGKVGRKRETPSQGETWRKVEPPTRKGKRSLKRAEAQP